MSHPALYKDSFRKWKRVLFEFCPEQLSISLHKKSKTLVCFPVQSVSLSLVEKTLRFTQKKKNTTLIQFESADVAKQIFEQLINFTKDFSTEISLDKFEKAAVMANEAGKIIKVNEALLVLLGWKEEEIIGQGVTIMMDTAIARIHDSLMEEYWKTGVRRLIGKQRLVKAKHKSGYLFPCVIELGEAMENFNGEMIPRVIATLTPEVVDLEEISSASALHSAEQETSEASEDWSEEEQVFNDIKELVDVVDIIAAHIELKADTEGILSKIGLFKETNELWDTICSEVDKAKFATANVHSLSDVLKRSLQKYPILTTELYNKFIELSKDVHSSSFFEEAITALKKLPQANQMIMQRLFLLFSHILSRSQQNKMDANTLAGLITPVLIQQSESMESKQLFTISMEQLIKYSSIIVRALPKKHRALYKGPGRLSDNDWTVLMTKSEVEEYSSGTCIIPDEGRHKKLYYLASGIVAAVKNGCTISSTYSGEYIVEMTKVGANSSTTAFKLIAIQPCKILKLSVDFLTGLFETNNEIFFKFFWEQARALALRLRNLPLIISNVDLNQNLSGNEITKLQIHFGDGGQRWMDFPLHYTVADIGKYLREQFPKYSKHAYLIEASHGRDISKLEPNWTVQELLVRAKYACDYKIIYVSELYKSSLKLSMDESIVIEKFSCKMKKKDGTLFVLQTELLHIHKLFGLHSKVSIPYSDITSITRDAKCLTVISNNSKSIVFTFPYPNICSTARKLITSLCIPSAMSPKNSRTVSGDLEQQWAVITKQYKIFEPQIDLVPGCLINVDKIVDNEVFGFFKKKYITVPVENVKFLPMKDSLPVTKYISGDIQYVGLEQLPSINDWATILLHGNRMQFTKGEIIIPEGSKLQRLFQIESGFCKIATTLPNDESVALAEKSVRWRSSIEEIAPKFPFQQLTIQTIGQGDTFGEMSLLIGEGCMASVIADGGPDDITTVFMIEVSSLAEIFKQSPKIGARFSKYIHNLLRKRMEFECANRECDLTERLKLNKQ